MPLCSIHTKHRPKLYLYLESLSEKNADKNWFGAGHLEDNLDVADVGKNIVMTQWKSYVNVVEK